MINSTVADAIFWVAVACCLVAQAAILRSVFVGGRATVATPRRIAEVAWAVVPTVALALVLVATWRTLHPPAVGDADRQSTPPFAEASL